MGYKPGDLVRLGKKPKNLPSYHYWDKHMDNFVGAVVELNYLTFELGWWTVRPVEDPNVTFGANPVFGAIEENRGDDYGPDAYYWPETCFTRAKSTSAPKKEREGRETSMDTSIVLRATDAGKVQVEVVKDAADMATSWQAAEEIVSAAKAQLGDRWPEICDSDLGKKLTPAILCALVHMGLASFGESVPHHEFVMARALQGERAAAAAAMKEGLELLRPLLVGVASRVAARAAGATGGDES